MTAAAYAKDLLCRIPSNKVEAEKRIVDIVSGFAKGVNELRPQHDKEHQSILDWLTPINCALQQNDYFKKRQPETGQWFLKSEKYQAWLKTAGQTLFCPGMPGAGKTIITSLVIEHLRTNSRKESNEENERGFSKTDADIGIAFLYCSFQRHQEQKLEDLLASLLKQLSHERSPFPHTTSLICSPSPQKSPRTERTRHLVPM